MSYFLAEACKNTFIVFDCLHLAKIDDLFFHQVRSQLFAEKRDDALILIDGKAEGNAFLARMLVIGHDGVLGEFCGNGARACAAYLMQKFSFSKRFFLVTDRGIHELKKHENNQFSVKLPAASFNMNKKFIARAFQQLKRNIEIRFVDMIEPHLIFESSMNAEELSAIGQEFNQRKDIFPLGINLNAYQILSEDRLAVKTYERGAQRVTRSCGTGAAACAAFYKQSEGRVFVTTKGGNLEVALLNDGIELKGPAFVCDTGEKEKGVRL